MALGFPSTALAMDLKRHPRAEPWHNPGRLRVEIRGKDGAPTVAEYDTKEKLLRGLGRVIPGLETRRLRNEMHRQRALEFQEAQRREHAKRTGQPLAIQGGGSSGSSGAGRGSGGSKKR